MTAIFFALVTYVGWGVGDVFGTVVTRKLGGYSTTFWQLILRLIIFSLYIPFALDDIGNISLDLLFLNLALGVIWLIGVVAFYEGLRIGIASIVATSAASFSAVTVILSILFLGENITSFQAFAIIVIFIGNFFSTLDIKEIIKKKRYGDVGNLMGLISMFCWGIYFAFIKIVVKQISWFWPNYISLFLFPLLYIFMKQRLIKVNIPVGNKVLIPLLSAVVLTGIADFSYNIAIERGMTAVVAPIGGSNITLFVVLSFIFFKDSIGRQQAVGIITSLAGIVFLSILTV